MKQGWTYMKLGDIAEVIHGKNQKDVISEDGQYPIYGSGGNIMGYARDYLCEANTTILGRKGSINNPQFITERFWNVDTAFGIFGKNGNDSKFIYYFIKSIDWSKKNTGTTLPSLTQQVVKSVELSVPSLNEQQRIVEYLDAAFAQIDELKANAEKQLAEARALFQAALTQAMQPKPGWQEKKLVNVCDIFGRIGFRGYTTKDLVSSQNDGAISLSPSNIQNGEMDYSKRTYISWFKYNESPEIKIFNGDILLVKTGSSYGKSALVKNLPHEATINPQSVVLKNFRINNEFFAYQLRTERVKKEFDQFVSGTAIPTFSQAKLGIVPIYFPGEIEQEQIVSYLNSINNLVKELEEINRKTATECDALKQALLRQIFE